MNTPPPAITFPTQSTPTATDTKLAELQGLDGPYGFSELLLQKIWAQRDFAEDRAYTADGRRFVLRQPGRWNRLGGPDFQGASWTLDGETISGDIELHLRASDWQAHGHARDPHYRDVRLHVVLFPPAQPFSPGPGGLPLPILALLPLLTQALEDHVADAAMAALAQRPADTVVAELARLEPVARAVLLQSHAERRWAQKIQAAHTRLTAGGWTEACHQTALEILGYRFNRAACLALAREYPLAAWPGVAHTSRRSAEQAASTANDDNTGRSHDSVTACDDTAEAASDALYTRYAEAGRWQLHGLRPANHPRTRLRQYTRWVQLRPHWPATLRSLAAALPVLPSLATAIPAHLSPSLPSPAEARATASLETATLRRAGQFAAVRRAWAHALTGDELNGPRFDTLICDGWLPLLAAATPAQSPQYFLWWWAWFAGDVPETATQALNHLGVFQPPTRPQAHGPLQGLLGWLARPPLMQPTVSPADATG